MFTARHICAKKPQGFLRPSAANDGRACAHLVRRHLFVIYTVTSKDIMNGPVVDIITSIDMLVYCAMIFPLLKSIVTMLISDAVLIASIYLITKA